MDLAYLCYLAYVLARVLKHRISLLKYGATPKLYAHLIVSLLACTLHWLLLFIPISLHLIFFYPLPLVALAFIPSIIVGHKLTHIYETCGTSLADDAEKIAREATWAGYFGLAMTFLSWILALTSSHVSKVY